VDGSRLDAEFGSSACTVAAIAHLSILGCASANDLFDAAKSSE